MSGGKTAQTIIYTALCHFTCNDLHILHIYIPTKILWFWMSPSLGNTAGFLYATVGGRFCLQGRHLAVVTVHKHWWLDRCTNTATHFFGSLVWLCSRRRFCTFMEMKPNSHSSVSLHDSMCVTRCAQPAFASSFMCFASCVW